MNIVTLDIETIAPGWHEDGFPPLPEHRPVVVSWLKVNTDTQRIALCTRTGVEQEEAAVLGELHDDLLKAHRLVTFNGRGFDMPLLMIRAMACGADWSGWLSQARGRTSERRARFPHWKDGAALPWHVDLLDQIGDYGAARNIGLDALCRAVDVPGKGDIDGSMVAALYAAGEVATVARYCEEDVLRTWRCYLLWATAVGLTDGVSGVLRSVTDAWWQEFRP